VSALRSKVAWTQFVQVQYSSTPMKLPLIIFAMVELKKKPTEEIVAELRQGLNRESNYKLLFERYHDQVYRFFQRKGMGREDCRDLTQDVFVSVHRGLKNLRDPNHFHTWLFRIARNVFKNELERRQAKKRTGTVDDELEAIRTAVDPRTGPMEELLEKERRERLTQAVKDLPPQMQRCVHLRVRKALSISEIAAVMQISTNTVKAHLHQARKALKEKLGDHFDDSEF
jgi:RNA polymerase sigma-70 factor (ECF subfamily)